MSLSDTPWNGLNTSWGFLKTSWRCLEDVLTRPVCLQTSWRYLGGCVTKANIIVLIKAKLYMFWRRFEDVLWRGRLKKSSRVFIAAYWFTFCLQIGGLKFWVSPSETPWDVVHLSVINIILLSLLLTWKRFPTLP